MNTSIQFQTNIGVKLLQKATNKDKSNTKLENINKLQLCVGYIILQLICYFDTDNPLSNPSITSTKSAIVLPSSTIGTSTTLTSSTTKRSLNPS